MSGLKDVKIGSKLLGGFLIVDCLFIAGLVPSYRMLSESKSLAHEIKVDTYRAANLSLNLKLSVVEVQDWLTDISATRAAPGFDDGFKEAETYARKFKRDLSELRSLSPEMKGKTEGVEADFDGFYAMGKVMAEAYIKGGPASGNPLMEKFDPVAGRISMKMEEIEKAASARIEAALEKSERLSSRSLLLLLIATGMMLALGIGIAVLITAGIARPLKISVSLLDAIAKGDLSDEIPPGLRDRKDEIGDLGRATHTMSGNLRKLLGDIKEGVVTLASSSTELTTVATSVSERAAKANTVAAAAEASSSRTVAVAASLEQASTALMAVAGATEQMSATIGDISSNSVKARVISEEAGQQASRISAAIQTLG